MGDEQVRLAETLDAEPYEPPKARKRRLVAVLLGVMGLLVVSVAAPMAIKSIRKANETHAVSALRQYAEAQMATRRQQHNLGSPTYADRLASLQDLLPMEIVAAHGPEGTPYHGYLFRECRTFAGAPIDWSQDYALCATPASYGLLRRQTFLIATNGCIFGWDLGQSGFVDDYPEFTEGGWVVDDDTVRQPPLPLPVQTPLQRK